MPALKRSINVIGIIRHKKKLQLCKATLFTSARGSADIKVMQQLARAARNSGQNISINTIPTSQHSFKQHRGEKITHTS
jgi:hypothetical protein